MGYEIGEENKNKNIVLIENITLYINLWK